MLALRTLIAVLALYWDAPQPLVQPLRIESVGVQIGAVYVADDVASINLIPPQRACWSVTATDASGQTATWRESRDCRKTTYLPFIERTAP